MQQGCACDNSLLNVLPMVNSSPEAITTGAPPALGIAVPVRVLCICGLNGLAWSGLCTDNKSVVTQQAVPDPLHVAAAISKLTIDIHEFQRERKSKLLRSIADGERARAAVRVGQVTSCAAAWNGGPIYDPCTGSSGPGYYANRRMAQ